MVARPPAISAPRYLAGLGNHFESEALAGALPVGRNSPQRPAFGLYAEQLSATAFTAARHDNRRSWLYRIRPSADHPRFEPWAGAPLWRSAPLGDVAPDPNRQRWDPLPLPVPQADFVEGMAIYAAAGDCSGSTGLAAGLYAADRSMERRAFSSADGEMLIVPQLGRLHIVTELGPIEVEPNQVALIPRGLKIRVELPDGPSRGYLCENYGAPFRLPELGPIGANGLAIPRDFEAPRARFEEEGGEHRIIAKYGGHFFSAVLDRSPFDVVAWHGNLAPFRYDLRRFNTLGTVSFDHPDPSILTVLTSPSEVAGTANCDFVLFPPRWMVAEDTFRPPYFHRNLMSEFMGLITGRYDAKAGGFSPGGASLHNRMAAHGPDLATWAAASAADLAPHRLDGGMAFMFESRLPLALTRFAHDADFRQSDYDRCWHGFPPADLSRK